MNYKFDAKSGLVLTTDNQTICLTDKTNGQQIADGLHCLELVRSFALIESDYVELLFHDFPILFTGKNRYKDRIVGSFVEHLNDADVYFHSIVDAKTYSNFENQIITYRELLRQARFIFNVRIDDNENVRPIWIQFDEIPLEYLPSETATCPALYVDKG